METLMVLLLAPTLVLLVFPSWILSTCSDEEKWAALKHLFVSILTGLLHISVWGNFGVWWGVWHFENHSLWFGWLPFELYLYCLLFVVFVSVWTFRLWTEKSRRSFRRYRPGVGLFFRRQRLFTLLGVSFSLLGFVLLLLGIRQKPKFFLSGLILSFFCPFLTLQLRNHGLFFKDPFLWVAGFAFPTLWTYLIDCVGRIYGAWWYDAKYNMRWEIWGGESFEALLLCLLASQVVSQMHIVSLNKAELAHRKNRRSQQRPKSSNRT
eukprot:Lithocolla_globosa_v1_NODE_4797_length_1362_cov_4.101682.p1 type:complete len:265 gc:universal NODE_4797_length_1362_cov_4.101682:1111-317(-)